MKALRAHGWLVLVASVSLGGAMAVLGGDPARADVSSPTPTPPASVSVTATQPLHDPVSEIIFPPRNVPIHFDHAAHAKLGAKCADCHPNALTSTKSSDRIVLSVAACDRCHGTRHDDLNAVRPGEGAWGACASCHEGYKPGDGNRVKRVVVPNARLRFNHRAHAVRSIGCGHCHGSVQRAGKATGLHLPQMQACLTCHDLPDSSRGDAKAACSTCHLTKTSGQIRTEYPNGQLLPPRWMRGAEPGPDFVNTHGRVAADDSRFCAQCHTEDQCVRCHDGRVRPRNVHPNDFLSMHGVAAKQNAQSCSSCHRHETFCKTCHMRAGVTATGPSWNRLNQGRIHPPTEVFVTGPVTGRHHATEARRNLMSCVGCHVERDCVGCHATRGGGGIGVNPHPAGFASRCGAAFSRNARPCLVCHDPGDPQLSRCR